MAVTRRDDLLHALAARVLLFRTTMDRAAILDSEALRMARELMRHVPDPAADPEAVLTLADLHRCRSVLLGAEAGRQDAAIAAALDRYAGRREARPDPDGDTEAARLAALHERARAAVVASERHRGRRQLEEAVRACEAAVAGTPRRLRPLYASALALQGVVLRLRYEREGRPEDLDAAVAVLREAEVAAGPGHPERSLVLSGLCAALRERYEHRGALDDVTEAVRVARAAVDEGGSEDRGGRLHNLGLALRMRHERTGDPKDLTEAVAAHEEAVLLAPPGHRDHVLLQQGLANVLRVRRERGSGEADSQARIDALEAAAADADTTLGPRVGALLNLASALTERFQLAGRAEDADRAESLLRTAAAALAARHPRYAGVQHQLGLVLAARGRPGASAALRAAALHPTATPLTRLRAAHAWGFEAMTARRPEEAATAYGHALAQLPALASRHLPLADAERVLAESRGLAADAAACALAADAPARALSLLESGRGVLLARALGDPADDLPRQRAEDPRTADRRAWRGTGQSAYADADEVAGVEAGAYADAGVAAAAAVDRAASATPGDATPAVVRRRAGSEEPLLPSEADGLLSEGADGPVVLVNVSRFRCDALVITPEGLLTVPLPRLTLREVVDRTVAFLGALERLQAGDGGDLMAGPAAEDELDGHLGWLWDGVTGPVLDALGITGPPADGRPPRVWWIPTGPLAFLPLHAGGHHREATGRTVLDRTVPSYAPTVRALAAARRRTAASVPSFLVVAVPEAPGAPPLPGAAGEGAAVAGALPGARLLAGEAATRDAVVSALADHTWLHFCGHGTSEPLTAVGSRLLVHDHLDHPLTVAGISRLDLSGADLAYLSACGTARSGFTVMDEGLHLAGGLQLAGFRHVVGTLWEIEDTLSVRIAEQVYAGLGAPRPVADRAAYAVREAVRGVRDRYLRTPSLWAAHIHVGP
ncbi:hypothetical protein DEJ45_32540 [Streptomyces venezuelae]|uniref:CHAT domain-containing protein n=1 Tax=Streptomyces venezuelae TaxID=54571 RepID=UPI00123E371E|nr:CHAT domain-containing protein [Streptomyces venezuelae]QES16647.1 hypothetical protein DEJ45_32540 [Streptomyces venezuelae]